jgi:hypothetical protein
MTSVTTRSQVFCRSMRPGSPMIRMASSPSSTVGATHGGFTRYFAGSATCKTAATTIASPKLRQPDGGSSPGPGESRCVQSGLEAKGSGARPWILLLTG